MNCFCYESVLLSAHLSVSLYVCLSVSYAILTEETWHWRGSAVDGIRHLMAAVNMEPDQWQLGRTKVFVKNPESVSGVVGWWMCGGYSGDRGRGNEAYCS